MSNVSKRKREGTKGKIKSMGDHKEFMKRISKTLYYGHLPSLPCLSLPVTEISCELWSMSQRGRSLRRLHTDEAASIARSACVSPCALVLAILYLERLKACNPDYLAAANPSDLFLVSLMVGNKFLQDDGEDDEVICSEWAASGGMDIQQLKRLEIDFLNAIDWKVYVSEDAFKAGLQWLERQVALKQAQLRGFFTYTDLAATYDNNLLAELISWISSSYLALSLSYVTSLMTFMTSTLVISQAWLPSLQYVAATRGAALTTIDTNILTTNMNPELPQFTNATVELPEVILDEAQLSDSLRCCTDWSRYHQQSAPTRWHDAVVLNELKTCESWWCKTSVLNWLYQSSLVNPLQRWLEKINQYGDLFAMELLRTEYKQDSTQRVNQCGRWTSCSDEAHCVTQAHWLNLRKLSALTLSMTDR